MNKKYLILIIIAFIILIPILFYLVSNNYYQIAPLKDYNHVNKKIIVPGVIWNI